jgi:hypothetical protein
MRRLGAVLVSLAWTAGLLAPTAAPAAPRADRGDRLEVYVGEVPTALVGELTDLGIDRHDLRVSKVRGEAGPKGSVRVEAILSAAQARQLGRRGLELEPKTLDGRTVTERATEKVTEGMSVFRPYSGPGGIQRELRRAASRDPRIAKLVDVGDTVQGQDILAVKVTKHARRVPDGRRPSVLYLGAQHAREWITPEMVRRLMHRFLDGYGRYPRITRLVNTTEVWFVPVANPDGYDYTFEPGQRLWRKNLRDNNDDGVVAPGDGVDLNRNYPTRWGYDNEGSSPDPSSETYRGPSPASEPETQALEALFERVGFEFLVNYHSAAELLLYGTGWQVSTPTPDDIIYEAMAGDDEEPAIPNYDPDISAELYTTNGDTDTHATEAYGTLGFTPEMATCETVSESDPDDEWDVLDCGSGFEFPDDPGLVRDEYLRNVPFALSVAESADDPDDPVSVVGRTAEDFRVDTFEVSYGAPQTVAVWAKRAMRGVTMRYRINDGPVRSARAPEWSGGERYGDENDDYYAERRGRVRGAAEGDDVTVWFTGRKASDRSRGHGKRVRSDAFTYAVASDTGHDVLVLANEDYEGVDPDYPPEVTAPKYADAHLAAVEAAGYSADLWDVSAQGVPHDLGVLAHYDAVLWYLGDNRLTQDPEDALTSTPFGEFPDLAVAERQQYLTLAVRDFLNEGGKLVHAGESAQHQGAEGISDTFANGLYYGLNGDPTADCVISPRANPDNNLEGFFEDCLILADDFRQYYLGGYTRSHVSDPPQADGAAPPFLGFSSPFGGPGATTDNPLDEAGSFRVTSDILPVEEFPQFASEGTVTYPLEDGGPFAPVEGDRYAGIVHVDSSYMRLTRTVDVPAGATQAELQLQLSYDVEEGYDHVFVEAHTPGQDDWTTLPEVGGATQTAPPAECAADGFLLAQHPFLTHYLGGADCSEPGTSGTWNTFTGDSGGWQQVAFDLTPYAGQQVELSITYLTDPAFGGTGAFVDDTRVVIDGVTDADGFEGATSDWTPSDPPAGSPPSSGTWMIGGTLASGFAGVSTEDTDLFGFGLEQLPTTAREELLQRSLDDLLD